MFVSVENLCFRYRSQEVIHQLCLEIQKGEILSILGSSGSGKSTVLRLLSGLETPNEGSITVAGQTVADDRHFLPPEKRSIGMVFQDYALFPHMTIRKNIEFGLGTWPKKERKPRAEEMLRLVRMEAYKNRYPHELSGGQQQRIALARALAPKPALLLLDEPFSSLDADLQINIRNELHDIIKQTETTTVFVTHDREDAKAIADRIVTMRDGAAHDWDSICMTTERPVEQKEKALQSL
ncbi:ABC transporter ATP-binding protein [Salimicrobium halophilum]|uniref:Carnitine transport ATP-binding protein OpuCA n=1 Tax=Salimicrobium halophilum TaxID=86666 RepID=A0A1G8ST54_9BACI|nr:ABC transporter ATP-binding protein [Salimicrobium halophilum]SDJ32333.1 iron(III) transport system ATP-binding protein [Salimicrobium halophilum]